MKWSYRIATVAGIEVRIHVTFLLILGVFALLFAHDGGLEAALFGTLFFLALFFCVVLHEFGHAFAARAYGIRTPDITLYPIGGVARLERMPSSPWYELVIALAGPAVNVAIAAILWIAVVRGYSPRELFDPEMDENFWSGLLRINILLVLFNMIPAFPMDGGRVVRALLATRLPYATATMIAARIGQVLAIAFVVVSFTGQASPMLLVIGMFVFMGAQQELNFARSGNRRSPSGWPTRCWGDLRFYPMNCEWGNLLRACSPATMKSLSLLMKICSIAGWPCGRNSFMASVSFRRMRWRTR